MNTDGEGKVDGLLFRSKQLPKILSILDEFEGEGYCRTAVDIYLSESQKP